jgi:hypothetical protein
MSGAGSDNKIQIGCNIPASYPNFVKVRFPAKADQCALICLTIRGLPKSGRIELNGA